MTHNGEAEIRLDLLSIDTNIEIRNQRIRDLLFHIVPNATYTASVDLENLINLDSEASADLLLQGTLNMNGVSINYPMPVLVTRLASGQFLIENQKDNEINLSEFGFAEGINQLKSLAKLNSISALSKFTFKLVFSPSE